MLSGETVNADTNHKCGDCGNVRGPMVLRSAAGHYIGFLCDCGPYSRETDYYKDKAAADEDLKKYPKLDNFRM